MRTTHAGVKACLVKQESRITQHNQCWYSTSRAYLTVLYASPSGFALAPLDTRPHGMETARHASEQIYHISPLTPWRHIAFLALLAPCEWCMRANGVYMVHARSCIPAHLPKRQKRGIVRPTTPDTAGPLCMPVYECQASGTMRAVRCGMFVRRALGYCSIRI